MRRLKSRGSIVRSSPLGVGLFTLQPCCWYVKIVEGGTNMKKHFRFQVLDFMAFCSAATWHRYIFLPVFGQKNYLCAEKRESYHVPHTGSFLDTKNIPVPRWRCNNAKTNRHGSRSSVFSKFIFAFCIFNFALCNAMGYDIIDLLAGPVPTVARHSSFTIHHSSFINAILSIAAIAFGT